MLASGDENDGTMRIPVTVNAGITKINDDADVIVNQTQGAEYRDRSRDEEDEEEIRCNYENRNK